MIRAASTLRAALAVLVLGLAWIPAGIAPVRAAFDAPALEADAATYRTALIEAATARDATPVPRPRELQRRAEAAVAADRWVEAAQLYERLVGLSPDESRLWLRLAQAWRRTSEASQQALLAGLNAHRTAPDDRARAAAMLLVAQTLDRQENYRLAIRAYDESVGLADDKDAADRRDFLRRQYGFRIIGTRSERDSDTPRICLDFSDPLSDSRRLRYADYIRISPEIPVEVRAGGSTICLDGVAYGNGYEIRALAGLPSAEGDRLTADDVFMVTVADRDPVVAFRGRAYILPRHGAGTVPLTTVNLSDVALQLMRINDRNLVEQIVSDRIGRTLAGYEVDRIIGTSGEVLWSGHMAVTGEPNRSTVTGVPVAELLPQPEPGVYVLAARNAADLDDQPDWSYADASLQWLVISDLGLVTFDGADGLHVAVRSLETGRPVSGVPLTLLARNNAVLGRATSDAGGLARFDAGVTQGTGGNRPAGVLAHGEPNDFNFLDLTEPGFDLSDRGVSGRAEPGPIDAWLYTERGVYRPGETVELIALLRDDRAMAMAGLPLTLEVRRPDGVEVRSVSLPDQGGGARRLSLPLPQAAHSGVWTVAAQVDPDGEPVGTASFQVEDFVPSRIRLDLTGEGEALRPGRSTPIALSAQYFYDAPAIGLTGDAALYLRPAAEPWPHWAGFRFGLVREQFQQTLQSLEMPPTDQDGRAILDVLLTDLPDSSLPLEAEIRASVFDVGGRAVNAELVLPVRRDGPWIGVRPRFQDNVPDGQPAGFEIIALDADGNRIAAPRLDYQLVREIHDYQWYSAGGAWAYRLVVRDRIVTTGTLAVAEAMPAELTETLDWGRYRLEVTDPASGAATSLRFTAGWWVAPQAGETPDTLRVTLDRDRYRAGDTARLHVEPPFAGEVLVLIANNRVLQRLELTVPAEGMTAEFTVGEDWTAGAYVLATAFRPGTDRARGPGRAVGVAWFGIDMSARTLNVALDAPAEIRPRQTLSVPVQATGGRAGEPAWLTLAAVDEGILTLTDFASPDPTAHYYGRRALGVEMRDAYGRLIVSEGPRGTLRSGGDGGENAIGPEVRSTRTVALFSGIVPLDADGRATVPLEIPDFNGELRLMAVAWSGESIGSAARPLTVRDPLVAELALPHFLAPGDRAGLSLSLHNVAGPAGRYTARIETGGGVRLEGAAERTVELAVGERSVVELPLLAEGLGTATLAVELSGPDGFAVRRDWQIAVRPAQTHVTSRIAGLLQPGQTLVVDAGLTAGFLPDTASVAASFSTRPNFDVPGLLTELAAYPYGCVEQITSGAMPLLYVSETVERIGQGRAPDDVRRTVQQAINRILTRQFADGSFAVWTVNGPHDLWLSAYAMDFLTRAREQGHDMPETAWRRGIAFLRQRLTQYDTRQDCNPAAAYSIYVLARADALSVSDLRYFSDTCLRAFGTPIARAQIAAAAARFGDRERAATAFLAAQEPRPERVVARDYGSPLRDRAAVATLMAEAGWPLDAVLEQADLAAEAFAQTRWHSTQEMMWALLTAHALSTRQAPMVLAVDGQRRDSAAAPVALTPDEAALARGIRVENLGDGPVRRVVTVRGVPALDQPAESNGFSLRRGFFTRTGEPLDLHASLLRQGDLGMVRIEGEAEQTDIEHQVLVVDLLPAGLEIENPRLGGEVDPEGLGVRLDLSATQFVERRDDRFVAAIDVPAGGSRRFAVAYLARAVTPGSFVQPAAFVEDMYQPRFNARTVMGRITVQPRE